MGLAEMMGWNNPFTNLVSDNSNALVRFGTGFAQGKGFQDGLAQGAQGIAQGAPIDDAYAITKKAEAERMAQINQTAEWLKANYPQYAGLPPAEGFKAALAEMGRMGGGGDNLMSVGGHLYDTTSGSWISPPQTSENRQNISLSGQWGTRNGEPVFLQPSSTGEMIEAQLPEGVQLQSPFELNADRAAGGAFGRQVGGAQFSLPQAQLMADQTLKAIEDVRSNQAGMDQQFGNIMGVPQQMTPAWPGSPKANFQVAAQRLTNRAFLEARQMLRGGGQITDFESRKAEGAITNMEDAMARGDKALFLKALDDFEAAVKDGYAKLQQQAGSVPGYGAGQSAPQVAPSSGYTILGVE